MNEQQQEQNAQKIMSEIVRLQAKLVDGGYSDKTPTGTLPKRHLVICI